MEDTVIVIMLKNPETGFLESEIGSYKIADDDELIYNIFAVEENGSVKTHIKLTIDKEIEDWEYPAIFDYYDTEVFEAIGVSAQEDDNGYDPMWEIVFDFDDNIAVMEERISNILKMHKSELSDVYEAIKDLKEEYTD